MEKDLMSLKKKYNECLERNKKAEEYLTKHTFEECDVKKENRNTGKVYSAFTLFDEVNVDLSKLIIEIEKNMGKKMTRYEILNGLKL